MDKRRIFSASQKREIYFRANGLCESCGCDLEEEDWHAHHIERYADGGLTDTLNGMALCVPCHKEEHRNDKPIREESMKAVKNRAWQQRALDGAVSVLRAFAVFLLEGAPGCGKTYWLAMLAKYLIRVEKTIDAVIVVVPSLGIVGSNEPQHKSGMLGTFNQLGVSMIEFSRLQTRNSIKKPPKVSFIVTYQGLDSLVNDYLPAWSKKIRYALMLDECHHMAMSNEWGKSCIKLQSMCEKTIMTTGTPFRTDRSRIPFANYTEEGLIKPDFRYSLAEAIADGVCKKPVFQLVNMKDCNFKFEFSDGTQTLADGIQLKEVTDEQLSMLKRELLNQGRKGLGRIQCS